LSTWFFASDLHGSISRYRKLLERVKEEAPDVLLLGGDLLPNNPTEIGDEGVEFLPYLYGQLNNLKTHLGLAYPHVYAILGNDDPRSVESDIRMGETQNLWVYMHNRRAELFRYSIYGYACIPPSPFLLKDWERYDVSHYVDPGCISPEEGWHTAPLSRDEIYHNTIQSDLHQLAKDADLKNAIFLFHAPPYRTNLDIAALKGTTYENVPLDEHVGSIAIRRFIESRKPHITLHGHIHESTRLSGSWKDQLGSTYAFSAAHDGNELALIRFDPQSPEDASRELI